MRYLLQTPSQLRYFVIYLLFKENQTLISSQLEPD